MFSRLFEGITGIHIHEWGKWGEKYDVRLNFYYGGIKEASCIEHRQMRVCKSCGMVEEKRYDREVIEAGGCGV